MAQINEWIKISNTSGEGDATITLTASTYNELTDRVANLKVSTRTKTAYVNIKQTAFEPSLSLSYNTLVFNQIELQDTTTVTSNVAWTAEPSADWITISQNSGDSGSTTVIIEVDTIGINESRTGYVTFYYGDKMKTLVVSQAYNLEFNVNPTSVDLTNGARTITITSNVDWTATTTDDWYTLSTTSGASGTSPITVTPSTTDVSEDIFGSIDFYSDGVKIGSVVVKQLIIVGGQFYFEPIESFTISPNPYSNIEAEYKVGNSDWATFNGSVSSTNERIYLRNLNYDKDKLRNIFLTSGKCNIGGNITTLLGDMKENYAYGLFEGQGGIINAKDLILPATTLAKDCYLYMFSGCDSLITTPELPATTLADGCYTNMFRGCTSLTTAPELPATTLANSCYSGMFAGCSSLTTAPELPATTLVDSCYQHIFNGCTSLTTAPILPATTLAKSCYFAMFAGCSSLTTAPELPVTTLAERCYEQMFDGCNSLTTAPELPATTLADRCYWYMFYNCTSLTTAPELPATTLANICYAGMFEGCTSLTTAPELPATTLTSSCYLRMFAYCTSLTTAPELPATTLVDSCYYGMFWYCSNLNYIKMLATDISASNCLYTWLSDVSPTGTFVKNANMNDLLIGYDIPSGWTVVNA